jgi:hypothetical protein
MLIRQLPVATLALQQLWENTGEVSNPEYTSITFEVVGSGHLHAVHDNLALGASVMLMKYLQRG